jgi:hypothetical protein
MITEANDLGLPKATNAAVNGSKMSAIRRKDHVGFEPHVATSEKEYSDHELDFLHAIEAYQARSGRKFPSWTEVLSVVREIGYVRPM